MNLNNKHYRQIVQRYIHLGPLPFHRGEGICCGWNWMDAIQNFRLPKPEAQTISNSDPATFVASVCTEALSSEEYFWLCSAPKFDLMVWWLSSSSSFIIIYSIFREAAFAFLHAKTRFLLFRGAVKLVWVAEIRINLSVENLQGNRFCHVNEDINYLLYRAVETLA